MLWMDYRGCEYSMRARMRLTDRLYHGFSSPFGVGGRQVPDFNVMYELYDPCTCMFFFRNKHIMIDLGTGNNNKVGACACACVLVVGVPWGRLRRMSWAPGLTAAPGSPPHPQINFLIPDKQEMIDIIETVYRGARKGRGLVVSPKDYSTKVRRTFEYMCVCMEGSAPIACGLMHTIPPLPQQTHSTVIDLQLRLDASWASLRPRLATGARRGDSGVEWNRRGVLVAAASFVVGCAA